MNSSRIFLVSISFCLVFILVSTWSLFHLDHGCLVTDSDLVELNGYYVLLNDNRHEFKQSDHFNQEIPEIFDLVKLAPASPSRSHHVPRILPAHNIIRGEGHTATTSDSYVILSGENHELYAMSSMSTETPIPPRKGWMRVVTDFPSVSSDTASEHEKKVEPSTDSLPLRVSHCNIKIQTTDDSEGTNNKLNRAAPPSGGMPVGGRGGGSWYSNSEESGLSTLFRRPANSLLLALNTGYAYRLRINNIPADSVSSSYQTVVRDGEMWRVITSSFSHYEVMHLLLNMASLWNMGGLEDKLGSFAYFTYSISLVPLTMIVAMLMYHVAIYRFRREDLSHVGGVGYSCVLFAWMTYEASLNKNFCPLGPSVVCFTTLKPFPTYLPFLSFNAGPFLLLAVISCVLPRASFIGHLSGIIVGFPISWGLFAVIPPHLILAFSVLIQASDIILQLVLNQSNRREFVQLLYQSLVMAPHRNTFSHFTRLSRSHFILLCSNWFPVVVIFIVKSSSNSVPFSTCTLFPTLWCSGLVGSLVVYSSLRTHYSESSSLSNRSEGFYRSTVHLLASQCLLNVVLSLLLLASVLIIIIRSPYLNGTVLNLHASGGALKVAKVLSTIVLSQVISFYISFSLLKKYVICASDSSFIFSLLSLIPSCQSIQSTNHHTVRPFSGHGKTLKGSTTKEPPRQQPITGV